MTGFAVVLLCAISFGTAQADQNLQNIHITHKNMDIHQIWSRATAPSAKTGVVYLNIENNGQDDDVLESASTPVAEHAMLHKTEMDGNVMKMSHAASIAVPGDGRLHLKPAGHHIMLMGLKAPLKSGASFPLTLVFEKAGAVTFDVLILKPGQSLNHAH